MRIAFLVGDIAGISGGSNVVIEHASGLASLGADVCLVTTGYGRPGPDPWHPGLRGLRVLSLAQASRERFEFAFATWWMTWFDLWRVPAASYGYLNQSLESRFHADPRYKRLSRLTYSLPLIFVTEARWLAELIGRLRPEAPLALVPNGLSRRHFPPVDAVPGRSGPVRVLVEGPWTVPFKGVPETFDVLGVARAHIPLEMGWLTGDSGGFRPRVGGVPVELHERIPMDRVRDVYRRYDVLLKLSRVEGVYGPPLEMFSQGGTAITYAVTGADEYVLHGHNGLLVEPFNRAQIARYLERLHHRPEWLATLRRNALATARSHPGWEERTRQLAAALERLLSEGYRNDHLRGPLRETAVASTRELALLRAGWIARVLPAPLACAVRDSAAYAAARQLLPQGVRAAIRRSLARAGS